MLALIRPQGCWHFPTQPVWTHTAMESPLGQSDKEMSHSLIYPALLLLLPWTPPSACSTRPYAYIQAHRGSYEQQRLRGSPLTPDIFMPQQIADAFGAWHAFFSWVYPSVDVEHPHHPPSLCACNITQGSPSPQSILACKHYMAQDLPLPPPCFSLSYSP